MTDTQQQSSPASMRSRTGVVRSVSGKDTASVAVNTLVKHPQYGKFVRRRTNLAVHCPGNDVQPGDVVEIAPCRRLSKTKSWRLIKVIRRYQAR
jgi:small subunit ribosomal protein S17